MKSNILHKSLFDHIANALVPDAHGEDFHLPDDFRLPELSDENLSKFADGAIDGIYIYHTNPAPISDEAKNALEQAMAAVGSGDREEAEKRFEELGQKARAISVIDDLQGYILEHKDAVSAENCFKYAIYAAFNGKDREVVKFGLSMLELLPIKDNSMRQMIRVIGLSDEFTIFAIFIMQQWENANEEIFRLAKKTKGWGRIHAVERLLPDTPEIREWLLREGVHNRVLDAYSALNCWEGTEAEKLLFGDDALSPEDFAAVGGILSALLHEGPCPGISQLENSDDILAAFLRKAQGMPREVIDKELIGQIKNRCGENGSPLADLAAGLLQEDGGDA